MREEHFVRQPRIEIAIALAVAAALVSCSGQDEKDDALELQLVAVEPVVAVDFTERILATGELRAPNHADIAAEVDGRVTELHIEEGTHVDAGAALLELDPVRRQLGVDAAKARVAEMRAGLQEARREVERRRVLRKNDIASMAAVEKAETEMRLTGSRLAAALAELGVAERSLSEATVRAPFAGMLVERKVSLGEYVQVGTPLVELVSLDPLDVVFSLAEVDSGRVEVGQRVIVTVAPFPDEEFEAIVDVVSPTIDPRSRTLRVKASLDNSRRRLRPGLFARADLGVAKRTGVPMIPDVAVLQRSDGSVVFVLDPDTSRVARRLIEIGGFQVGRVEVASGLRPGELVLTKGHPALVDGVLVRLYESGVPAESAEPAVALEHEAQGEQASEVSVQ